MKIVPLTYAAILLASSFASWAKDDSQQSVTALDEAGSHLYKSNCAICHGSTTRSMYAHASARFETVGELYDFMSQRMPASAPGSMASDDYVKILNYLLHSNGQTTASRVDNSQTAHTSKEKLGR